MTRDGKSLRLFFALPLGEAGDWLREVRRDLARFPRVLRAVAPENYHVTLKFLGDTPGAKGRRIIDGFLALDFGSPPPIPFAMVGLGAFPGLSSPRIIWSGLSIDPQAIEKIRSPIENLCASHGFEAESRPFMPHLTLARLRRDAKVPAGLTEYLTSLRDTRYGESVVTRIVLFRSDLDRQGPRYTVMAERILGGAG